MRTPRTNIIRLAAFVLTISFAVLGLVAVPALNAQDNNDKAPASFKVPDGYMQVQMAKFRGVMMIDPKKAAGIFVTYPDNNETTEALRQRILAFVAPMFIHLEKGKVEKAITWDEKPLPSHKDDGAGKALANFYTGATNEMQVAIFERTTGPRPLLYGYFAMRHKGAKSDDGKFLDEQGQGVKAFDKLWKSFPR